MPSSVTRENVITFQCGVLDNLQNSRNQQNLRDSIGVFFDLKNELPRMHPSCDLPIFNTP